MRSPVRGSGPRPTKRTRRTHWLAWVQWCDTGDNGDGSGRALDFEPAMSAAETVMWKISNDPLLRPIAGTLAVVDRPIDTDRFRRRVRNAVAAIARLRERVATGIGPVGRAEVGRRR